MRGRVTYAAGRPIEGATAILSYDKDLKFYGLLGQARTDADGECRFTCGRSDFRDPVDLRPRLYAKVMASAGQYLARSPGKPAARRQP